MKKILFPTDFSEAANHAFVYALNVAKRMGASITTLHTYQLPDINAVNLPHTLQEVYDSIDLEEFENYRDSVPALHRIATDNGLDQVPIEHVMEKGTTVPTILQTANAVGADMIIMGTTGASGLKEIFLGSVAGEVLEKANCTVLTIPHKAVFDGKIDKIALTTEFKDEEVKALRRVLDFAELFGGEVHCINVDTSHTHFYTKGMEKLKAEFSDRKNIHFEVLEGEFIMDAVVQYLEDHQIDILAMVTHKRNFFQELFKFSMTKSMSYHSNIPILSIQAHTLS
ncbi:MAG: universal stress protein [Phaeodactylibacter sp.]|nr:universal stress protein [Phaeodactylibacter sp.]